METKYREITVVQAKQIMLYATDDKINDFLPNLNTAMQMFRIDTPLRQAHFLAQIAHESGCLNYVREIASGNAYEGRKDLGNVHPGDGPKFKGRGLIQLTGRTNYQRFQDWLNLNSPKPINIMANPELLGHPFLACVVSGWFWDTNNINHLADKDDVRAVTRRINGGLNGLAQRTNFLIRAKQALGL